MADLCTDNRFELIEKFKKKLIESTNIETSPEEMNVLDNILFRFWQMGWLDKLELPPAQPDVPDTNVGDMISRRMAIDAVEHITSSMSVCVNSDECHGMKRMQRQAVIELTNLQSAQPDHIADGSTKVRMESKYEYHYDHTDCIWYRPEARNRCPSTCAQYRDGWNDAMQYIFRDGKGYRPYRRDKHYEGSD